MERFEPKPRIAILREHAKLTQLELSQQVGVTETTIANWEKGRSGIDWIERIVRLCSALGCAPEELIGYIPEGQTEVLSFTQLRELIGTQSPVGIPSQTIESPNKEIKQDRRRRG